MSKQGVAARLFLSPEQLALAKTLYATALRDAMIIGAIPIRSSPPRAVKKPKLGLLFRGGDSLPADSPKEGPSPTASADDFDQVADEMKRWEYLSPAEIQPFFDDAGRALSMTRTHSTPPLLPSTAHATPTASTRPTPFQLHHPVLTLCSLLRHPFAVPVLNEFHMMWTLRDKFPLHFIVFKQTASHIPHEVCTPG